MCVCRDCTALLSAATKLFSLFFCAHTSSLVFTLFPFRNYIFAFQGSCVFLAIYPRIRSFFLLQRPNSVGAEVLCSSSVRLSCQLHLQQQHCGLQEKRPNGNPSQPARGHRRNVSIPAHQIRHRRWSSSISLLAFICLFPSLSRAHSLVLLSFFPSVALHLLCSKHIKSLW